MGQDDQDGEGEDPGKLTGERLFDTLLAKDARNERRIFWSEVAIVLVVASLVTVYLVAVWLRLGAAAAPRL